MNFEKINNCYKKVSYHRKPEDLTIEEWQFALRKKFAETSKFSIVNQGKHPVFSDFIVYNPETGRRYKVALRSVDNSANFCECSDFKTNELGTCKHIEAVLHSINNAVERVKKVGEFYTPAYSSFYLDYRGGHTIRMRIGTENTSDYNTIAHQHFNEDYSLKESEYLEFTDILHKCRAINESFRCYPDAMEKVIEIREKLRRNEIVGEKYEKHLSNGAFDKLVNAKLFPYQKEGICFAASRGRCIIADDMGLGKTLQAIAAAELLKREMGISSVFIICPTSLKYQWKTEIEKFTGDSAWVIEGIFTKRQVQYRNDSFYKIISYNTAINDIKEINSMRPDLFILDEAQRIKNFNTKISRNIKLLKSPYTFVLTGTPLENKLEELYSIVQFVNPFTLGPYWRYLSESRLTDETGRVTGYHNLNRIGEKLATIMIRRRKKDVLLQLPERMDKVLYVSMTEEQGKIHNEGQDNVSRLVTKWRKQGFLNEKDRQLLMIFLNSMRMVCDSTYILDQKTRFDTKIDELMNILDQFFAETDEKVVVFSQWERMTRLVAAELDKREVKYQYLHGGVPSSERGKLYEGFNNDPDCKVFLSTDAGGVGLNLQVASLLINMDIPWNPAVLEQRIARVYRMGQKRNVTIINMVSAGTIEHKMLGLLSFKKGLSEGILDQGENSIFLDDSKFKVLMNTVESIVDNEKLPGAITNDDTPGLEKGALNTDDREISNETPELAEKQLNSDFEDEGEFVQPELPFPSIENQDKNVEDSPGELLHMGMTFFGRLSETLSSPEATKKFVSTIVHTDEKDGSTYLKIPVENQKVVENAMNLFASLLGGMKNR